jgi:hypothetical protein
MSLQSRLTFVVLWVLSIFVVAVLVSAQTQRDVVPPPAQGVQPVAVISGADFGFRPDGWKGKARTGTFVVRINGEWVDVIESAGFRTLPLVK